MKIRIWLYSLIGIAWCCVGGSSAFGSELDDSFTELRSEAENMVNEVDINRKVVSSKRLVRAALKHLEKVSVERACNDFIRNAIWREGELFISIFTDEGVCLAHGDDHEQIWKSIKNVKGVGGGPLITEMLSVGARGGRVSYLWNNGFRSAYVKTFVKDGMTYVVDCGFYPENSEFATKQLVKTAISYFAQNGKEATFALISNPNGPFVKGDIYMFVYNYKGVNVAHGNNAALVGQNLIDLTDSRGKPQIKDIIDVAKNKGKGWYEYVWKNEPKRAYIERMVDPSTKIPYAVSAGYYPKITLPRVENYVKRAIGFLKSNGAKEAMSEFSNVVGQFAIGGLGIMVFNYEGKCLANGINPAYTGQNLLKLEDDQGRLYVRDIIAAARKSGKVLLSFALANATAIIYAENVETPDGKYIMASIYYPSSKISSTQTLVNRALDYFNDNTAESSFDVFSGRSSNFVRGDLTVFVYDEEGTRLVNGPQKSQIWENYLKLSDQQGKSIVSDLIAIGINGGGWATYQVRNARRRIYVKAASKTLKNGDVKNYIIGSGYFL
ncbi:cache domain-containing protein [Candidatus Dependentiae bacterium]|nr:cache domain-containing protein [Candidatus Dependentiae bacterium]